MSGGLPGTPEVVATPAAVAERTATWLLDHAARVTDRGGVFQVALAGGSTPTAMFDLLATPAWSRRAAWWQWEVWFGDERASPPGDPGSNFHLADEHLLRHVAVSADRIHRIAAELPDLAATARAYAAALADRLPPGPGGAPRFDAVLLGLGSNGHTASLFPGEPVLEVDDTWAAVGRADYPPFDRITLTFPTLNAAAAVAFAVAGGEKGQALREVAAGTAVAARVRPRDGELAWFLDAAAAAAMERAAAR